jgi:hypothetical protein
VRDAQGGEPVANPRLDSRRFVSVHRVHTVDP